MSHEYVPSEWQRTGLPAVRSPVIALEGPVLVVTTKQEGRMTEKKPFEGEKREQDSSACGCTSLPVRGTC